MKPISLRSLNTFQKVVIFGLIISACIANYYTLPLFSGASLIFGNVIAVALTIVFGGRIGIFTSILASSVTYLNWSHFLSVPPFLFEVLVVYYCVTKSRSLLLWGCLYWLTLGVMIVSLLFFNFTDFLQITKIAIVIKYVVNGVINILLGYAVAHLLTYWIKGKPLKTLSLTSFISLCAVYAVTFAVFTNVYYWLYITQADKLVELQEKMSLEAKHVATEIESYLDNGFRSITLLAETHHLSPAENKNEKLKIVASQHDDFLTMLKADKNGQIVASYPAYLMDNIVDTLNVSHRDYFYKAKKNLAPVLSEVFLGAGFGDDTIVAMSVPIIKNKAFAGIYEASLDLSSFAGFDRQQLNEAQSIIILDNEKRVVYSSSRLQLEPLQDMSKSKVIAHIADPRSYYFIDEFGEYLLVESEMLNNYGWQILVLLPRKLYEKQSSLMAVGSLTILFVYIFLLYIVIYHLAKKVSSPITLMSKTIAKAAENKNFETIKLDIKSSFIAEFDQMIPIIQRFSDTLGDTLNQVRTATLETQTANQKLAQLNQNLTEMVRDKTRELEHALYEANYANNAKSKFLANMSHEIRTPMNGVLGMLELLNVTELNDDQKQKVSVAQISAKALLNLINDILDLSKLDAGKLSFEKANFDITAAVAEAASTQKYLMENSHVELVFNFDEKQMYWCLGDAMRVRQVLTNLLSNAIKFTTEGRISISLVVTVVDSLYHVELAVEDSGIGIAEEKLSNLFNPFTQADESTTRKYGGTGLGLSIAKQLCVLMDGELKAESQVNKGSKFTATFNFPIGQPQIIEHQPTFKEQQDLSGLQILLVEDNQINQLVAKKMLLNLKANVIVANNGHEAIATLQECEGIDLVLMDCQMPEMDGFEATAKIRAGQVCPHYQGVKIIALTANAMKGDRQRCIDAGMDNFIAKPIDISMLQTTILATLQSKANDRD